MHLLPCHTPPPPLLYICHCRPPFLVLTQGHGLSWLVGLFAVLAHFPGIYQLVEVADRALDNEKISLFEAEVDSRIAAM